MHETKKISLFSAVAFAIGAMIGGGVFVLSGVALKQTGPSALLSFMIAGIIVLLSALSFAVIGSKAPPRESGYTYVGQVLGPIWGFMTSWCFYVGGIIGAAFVLSAFGAYVHEFIFKTSDAVTWSILAASLLTVVNLGPASAIGRIESFLVSGKLVILVILIIFGAMHFSSHSLTPFMPGGFSKVLTTSAFLFIAFMGFNVITSISGDIDNPRKNIPRAILLSMLVVTIIYIGVVISLLAAHLGNYSEASVGVAARKLIGPVGGALVVAGALVATLSSANANVLGSSEIVLRLASKKQVPSILGMMKNGHPYVSVFIGAAAYIALIISKQTSFVIGLANMIAITALIIVNLAAAKALAGKEHDGLRLPLGPLIPVIAIITAVTQYFFMTKETVIIGLILVASGLLIYSLRNRYHVPSLHKVIVSYTNYREGPLMRSLKR